jgi:hypothetical protein
MTGGGIHRRVWMLGASADDSARCEELLASVHTPYIGIIEGSPPGRIIRPVPCGICVYSS